MLMPGLVITTTFRFFYQPSCGLDDCERFMRRNRLSIKRRVLIVLCAGPIVYGFAILALSTGQKS